MRGRIVFVCGHANWGKSLTLRSLTDGVHQRRWTRIGTMEFWVRKMSNDDRPRDYMRVMGALRPETTPNVIAALCPAFGDRESDPARLLAALRDLGFALYFWVIEHQYLGRHTVTPAQIARLRKHGTVEVFSRRAEAAVRASALRGFVALRVQRGET
jgi:hypothetical protein